MYLIVVVAHFVVCLLQLVSHLWVAMTCGTTGILHACMYMYSKFRHLSKQRTALKTILFLLCKLFLHSFLWLIKFNYNYGF